MKRTCTRSAAWVDAGSPEGEAKDKPAPIQWRGGWNIQPDVVFQMPDPYPVPATGVLQYIYIVIPTGFVKDTWVTAAEIRPSARSVVHHMIAVVRPPGIAMDEGCQALRAVHPHARSRDGRATRPEHPQSHPVDVSFELLAAYSPGMQAQRFDIDHSAKLIPAGSDIVLQVHYTTNGKTAMKDQTKVGLTLAKEPPLKRIIPRWQPRQLDYSAARSEL